MTTVTKKLMSVALVPARMEALAQYVDVSRVSKLEMNPHSHATGPV